MDSSVAIFFQLTPTFLNLSEGQMRDINDFLIKCITGIVGYPKHFAEPKYLQRISRNNTIYAVQRPKCDTGFMLRAYSNELT